MLHEVTAECAPFTDWPVPGPIDLAVHDLPHESASTEWWYTHAHLETDDGQRLSLFSAFFRIKKATDKPDAPPEYAHSITWAITDPGAERYHPQSLVDRQAPKMGLKQLKNRPESNDPRLKRAMTEMLERGAVPAPDRMFEREPFVALNKLELDFDGARFEKLDDVDYALRLYNDKAHVGCDVVFKPKKKPVRHGDDGVVKGHGREDMFYYFIPRCEVTGTVTLRGMKHTIKNGSGWYDHEFGGPTPEQTNKARAEAKDASKTVGLPDLAWNWLGLQLDDESEVTAFSLVDPKTGDVRFQCVVHVAATGAPSMSHDLTLVPKKTWRSMRTFLDYPTAWQMEVPAQQLALEVEATFDDQEFITVVSKPAFWEGRVNVRGTIGGKRVSGIGFLERSGFEPIRPLDDSLSVVGEEVRKSVAAALPLEPTREDGIRLIASKERSHYLDGVDLGQISRALFAPIREITDRGGKSWRSYVVLGCCDAVGGDSRKWVRWLAAAELLHVGTLIIDDVQDKSTVRRGKPTAHVLWGEPIAVNAGTAAYFLAQKTMLPEEISDRDKLRLYDLYFEAMCAGHAGQAMDLDGPGDLMPAAIASGDSSALEARIVATHRLKTGAPTGTFARMGAIAGGGTNAQIEAVGSFFEAVGLAFQIIDDVLNLRGFQGDLKCIGEDIAAGTITLPVAKAMSRLGESDRAWVACTVASKPKDHAIVAQVIEKLEECGAISACEAHAQQLVEDAWVAASPLLEDSVTKVMLRALGWYVLERRR
jgi:geranylgeranyl pyrophosphate synthase/predicted secreted hydrolase